MSRVGKQPVVIPEKTEISYKNKVITVKGEKGSLTTEIHPAIDLLIEDKSITVTMEVFWGAASGTCMRLALMFLLSYIFLKIINTSFHRRHLDQRLTVW